jgi:hypothetical protein
MVAFRTWLRDIVSAKNLKTISDEVQSGIHTSPWLLEKIKERYPDIDSRSAGVAFSTAWAIEVKKGIPYKTLLELYGIVQTLYEDGINNYVKSDSNIQKNFKNIRLPIVEKYGKNSKEYAKSLTLLQFSREKWLLNRKEYNVKVAQKNADKLIMSDKMYYSVMDNIQLTSPNWADLAICCEMACGSRIVEILDMSTFEAWPDAGENWIKATGIAKQENKPKDMVRKYVIKPLIHISTDVFLNMIKSIREQLAEARKKYTSYELSQSKNSTINRRIKHWFKDYGFVDQLSTHDMRKGYGSLSYQLYANQETTSMNSWLSNVLAHSKDSLGVSLSYSTMTITTSPKVETITTTQDDCIKSLTERMGKLEIALNKEKDKQPIRDIPVNPRIRDGKVYNRLLHSVSVMKKKGVEVNKKNLKDLKYGTKVIGRYFKEHETKK